MQLNMQYKYTIYYCLGSNELLAAVGSQYLVLAFQLLSAYLLFLLPNITQSLYNDVLITRTYKLYFSYFGVSNYCHIKQFVKPL